MGVFLVMWLLGKELADKVERESGSYCWLQSLMKCVALSDSFGKMTDCWLAIMPVKCPGWDGELGNLLLSRLLELRLRLPWI